MEAMTSSQTATVTLPTDRQILITRAFDAPAHLVAYTRGNDQLAVVVTRLRTVAASTA